MREFVDERGRVWDVVIGRESWGSLYALFIPRGGVAAGIRQSLLEAVSLEEATRAVDELEMTEMCGLFERSEPKEMD